MRATYICIYEKQKKKKNKNNKIAQVLSNKSEIILYDDY